MIEAFPLTWPLGYPRTAKPKRSAFQTTINISANNIVYEVQKLGGTDLIISTNMPVKKDGTPYSNFKVLENDHGAAVYFKYKGDQVVIACDKWDRLQDNLRAIENSIEAMRGLERWGCSDILNRTFTGFKALPEAMPAEPWWKILGVHQYSPIGAIRAAYRDLVKTYHPDVPRTGDSEEFKRVTEAFQEALKEKGDQV